MVTPDKRPSTRWQKGKDVYWYTREKEEDEQAARERELALVKQREEDLMMEALGMKPRVPKPQAPAQPRLDAADMQRLINGQPEEAETEAAAGMTEDRVKGLGYNASRLTCVGWGLGECYWLAHLKKAKHRERHLSKPVDLTTGEPSRRAMCTICCREWERRRVGPCKASPRARQLDRRGLGIGPSRMAVRSHQPRYAACGVRGALGATF